MSDEKKAGATQAEHLKGLSRRSFLSGVGAATATAVAAPVVARAAVEHASGAAAPEELAPGMIPVALKVNGKMHKAVVDSRATLLDTLRESLHLTGTKKGCDHGQCGACTVHVDGRRMNSCLLFTAMQQGKEITTIEGLGAPGNLHPMQAAFVEHDGYQCGYCTSGQIMSAVAMIKEPWGKTDADIKEAMSGNICRCGAYPNIVSAVRQVRG